jgi:thermopsin
MPHRVRGDFRVQILALASVALLGWLVFGPAPAWAPLSRDHGPPLPTATLGIHPSWGGHTEGGLGSSGIAERIAHAQQSSGVPKWATYLPNVHGIAHRPVSNGHIRPLYDFAPAPMGVSDLGLRGGAGTTVGYVLNTTSIEGSMTLASATPFYLDVAGPYTFGIQLNTVLTNVTVSGNASNTYWTQNVVDYSVDSHQLIFIDNVWNFSSPSGIFPPQSLYSGNGTLVASTYYYDIGPRFNVSMPFTLNLFTNSSTVREASAQNSAVYFNYTLDDTTGHHFRGSYDRVEFNSSRTQPSIAHYSINGRNYTPLGLPFDAELVLGGPGGGSTQNLVGIQATMQLEIWNQSAGQLQTVPSAEGFGTDTGETVSGIAEYWTGGTVPTAHLNAGPSFLIPMWNAGGVPGQITLSGTATPTNAWLFLSNSTTYNSTEAQWAAIPPSGSFSYPLSPVTAYSAKFMLSDYQPTVLTFSTTMASTVSLARNSTWGVFTPLTAWGNAQLPAIASAGNGTLRNPYVLVNNEYGALSPEFSGLNDFLFPVFYGLLLVDTTAYVAVDHPAPFQVFYNRYMTNVSDLTRIGLPTWNDLQLELFNASHVTISNATATTGPITGWFYSQLAGFSLANLLIWNSTNILVAGNTFVDLGSPVMTYGGSGITFWGNTFLPPATPLTSAMLNSFGPQGIVLYSSGCLVYNNYFAGWIVLPASTPPFDIYDGMQVVHTDLWNVTPQPASHVRVVNGMPLSGNILGYPTQGGNFWGNYGQPGNPYGVLPYNDYGTISLGGDYAPITPPLHTISFHETGLPTGAPWSVVLNGSPATSTSNAITFFELAGTYGFFVAAQGGFAVAPGAGDLVVMGANLSVAVRFIVTFTYEVQFLLQGPPPGTNWELFIDTTPHAATGPSFILPLTNGTYTYTVSANDYAPYAGGLNVNGAPSTVLVVLSPLNATLSGTVSPAGAQVWFDARMVTVTLGRFSTSLIPGPHPIEATASGYYPYFNNVSVGANQSLQMPIHLTLIPSHSRPAYYNNSTGGLSGPLIWAVTGGLVLLAISIVIAALLLRAGRRVAPLDRTPGSRTVRAPRDGQEPSRPSLPSTDLELEPPPTRP